MAIVNEEKQNKKPKRRFCKKIGFLALAMLPFLRYYIDFAVDFLFGLYYDSRRKPIAEAPDPLILESATSLARKIRKREIKSEDVVRAFIERIKQVNPLLNAVVDDRFKEAIKEAQDIDLDILNNMADFNSKPFLGVPFTSKESTACKGMSFTFGLKSRKSRKASFDAEVVKRMKGSGAILLGVTNVPQLNLWQETSNPVYGTTNNPYNNTRNVGGSSGGEASIIAAGGSAFGIGTDIGGSLRIPAFMCGIYGHKPTSDLISTNGLTFRTGTEKDTMVVAGPMTKYAEDITPFLKVLLGNNVKQLQLDRSVDVFKDLKIYYVVDPKDRFISPFRDEMKQIMYKIVRHFEENSKSTPTEAHFEEMCYGGKLWRYWMTKEPNADFNRDIANREGRINSFMEIIKFLVRLSDFSGAVIFSLINGLLPKEKVEWAEETTRILRFKLLNILGSNGVLLYSSAPWPASYHNAAFLRPWNFNLFAIWNVLKFPVTQVPLGLSKDGLPLGVQVVSAPNQDHLTIAVAKELEKAFGGYVPPFKVKKQ